MGRIVGGGPPGWLLYNPLRIDNLSSKAKQSRKHSRVRNSAGAAEADQLLQSSLKYSVTVKLGMDFSEAKRNAH